MFRALRRWLLHDPELTAMANDIEKLLDRASDTLHRAEGLSHRMDRLANRVNTRMNRAGMRRGEELADPRDEEIFEEVRRHPDFGRNPWQQ